MKPAIVYTFFFVALAIALPAGATYTDRYDNTNVDEILNNGPLLKNYIDCLLDVGKCTPEGKELKEHISEALKNNCEQCTEAQKKGVRKVIKFLINYKKEEWKKICAKYDPENKYAAKYEKELQEINSN